MRARCRALRERWRWDEESAGGEEAAVEAVGVEQNCGGDET